MRAKKALYIYPHTSETYRPGGNSYIRNLVLHLSRTFTIVNKPTTRGLLDVLLKLPKCDALYFNWIEDIPDRRYGFLQVPLLVLVLAMAKISGKKIIWFIHNNISHSRQHEGLKKFIVRLMRNSADVILSHSNEVTLPFDRQKFHVFDHPVDAYQPLVSAQPYQYDLLLWGTVSPYKGITEFIDYISGNSSFENLKILIAGKFYSEAFYEKMKNKKSANVTLQNETLPESVLAELFSKSHYVLFTYNSPSVLSSAALCKTLSFGKEIIGPDAGSFKELGRKGLLHNYQSLHALEELIANLKSGRVAPVDKTLLAHYIARVSWDNFAVFVTDTINRSF